MKWFSHSDVYRYQPITYYTGFWFDLVDLVECVNKVFVYYLFLVVHHAHSRHRLCAFFHSFTVISMFTVDITCVFCSVPARQHVHSQHLLLVFQLTARSQLVCFSILVSQHVFCFIPVLQHVHSMFFILFQFHSMFTVLQSSVSSLSRASTVNAPSHIVVSADVSMLWGPEGHNTHDVVWEGGLCRGRDGNTDLARPQS